MRLIEAAEDRLVASARASFQAQVEAVRVGTIVAHDKRAANRWNATRGRGESAKGRGLTGMALENAIRGLAARNPEYVVGA